MIRDAFRRLFHLLRHYQEMSGQLAQLGRDSSTSSWPSR
jgi:hypothetical protein